MIANPSRIALGADWRDLGCSPHDVAIRPTRFAQAVAVLEQVACAAALVILGSASLYAWNVIIQGAREIVGWFGWA